MRRDFRLQSSILKKIEGHEYPRFHYESFSADLGGYEDVETPEWTKDEAYNIELLVREGKLGIERITDAPWLYGGQGEPYAETYVYLTSDGHDWLENRGLMKYVFRNLHRNIPTVVFGLVSALLISWALFYLGAPK